MSFRRGLKIAYYAMLLSLMSAWCAAAGAERGGDRNYPAAIRIIRSVSTRNRPFEFAGREYTATLYEQGGRVFLLGRLEEGYYNLGDEYLVEIGKNVVISKPGLVFEYGRMTVEYHVRYSGVRQKVSVPFGDVYGHKHVSKMPPYRESKPSKKYGVCGASEDDDAAIESCLPTLQELLRRDDAESLADMMIYPLPVNAGFSLTFIKNREEFIELYPRIFTPTRKREILKLDNTDIFRNYKGLMLDRGLWFTIATDGKPYFQCLFFVIE